MRVFISSTCFDLVDVRAEIAEQLRQIGITPVLSDDKLSDFQVKPDVNSIETCLVNVESCEEFILILDRRYGPSLKDCGFDDFSATHLEYKRALDKNIPVRVYVRDRLEADYSIWKRNGHDSNIKYLWISDKNTRLFELLNEHSKLQSDSLNSNWYSTFTSSIDLKAAITKHFEKRILPKRLVDAIQSNTFPLINIDVNTAPTGNKQMLKENILKVTLTNYGNAPAFNLSAYWERNVKTVTNEAIFAPNQSTSMDFIWDVKPNEDQIDENMLVSYESAIGISIFEKYCISGLLFRSSFSVASRALRIDQKFRRSENISIDIEDQKI